MRDENRGLSNVCVLSVFGIPMIVSGSPSSVSASVANSESVFRRYIKLRTAPTIMRRAITHTTTITIIDRIFFFVAEPSCPLSVLVVSE